MRRQDNSTVPDPIDLPPLRQGELDAILDKHAMFMQGRVGGARCLLQYKNLSGLSFHKRDLSQADFTGCLFMGSDLSMGTFRGVCFFACDLRNANISYADFSRTDLRGAYMAGADLTGTDLSGADLREGKIMTKGQKGVLTDRKRAGGDGAQTILSGAKLTGATLKGMRANAADFSDADLSGVMSQDASMKGANFRGANLSNADFSGANISQTDMRDTLLSGMVMDNTEHASINTSGALSEADMGERLESIGKTLPELLEEHTLWVSSAGKSGRQLDLSGYDLRDIIDLRLFPLTAIRAMNAKFVSQDLTRAALQSATFDYSDFRDCLMVGGDLRGSNFRNAKMTRVILRDAKMNALEFTKPDGSKRLQRTDFSGADLRYCDLRGANLRDCILMGASLGQANLSGCDLRGADFSGAELHGVLLNDAKLDGAIIDLAAL